MLLRKASIFAILALFAVINPAQAGNFAWLDGLSVQAQADESGFRTRLAARFHIGDVKVKAVIGDIGGHADAYMVLRLAEMSHLPVDTVIKRYHRHKGKGWGVLAKSLGIKPGSREFHALKRGHDLHSYDDGHHGGKGKDKGKKDKGNKGKNW